MSGYCQSFSGDCMNFEEMIGEMKSELTEKLKQASENYGFDFVKEKPIEDRKRFCWKIIQSN